MSSAKLCKVGDVITVQYSGKNIYDKIIQPKFMRKRSDYTWKKLVEQFKRDNINKKDST